MAATNPRSRVFFLLTLVVGATPSWAAAPVCDRPQQREDHPFLCSLLDRAAEEHAALAEEMTAWAGQRGLLVGTGLPLTDDDGTTRMDASSAASASSLPVVFAHGMGDSCFNGGMQRIGDHTSSLLGGAYVTCVPTGDTQAEDTTNGYFLNMDASVDVFAAKIRDDPKLRGGFHAIGFSQGNNVIRGYIARYNDPPVDTFLSVNGVNAGVGAVPYCQPKFRAEEDKEDEDTLGGGICDMLMEQASHRAYTEFTQQHSFQANYWRDPRPVEREAYQKFSQLARWNNEGGDFNQTLKDNYAKTNKFVWVLATKDKMVWPREGEHWGAPDPQDPFHRILPMNETEWYTEDLFGLKTAQEAGKNFFETFEGDHLQFEMEDFDRWVSIYLATAAPGGDQPASVLSTA